MTKLSRTFLAGRMNKIVDERLLPDGEYIDAMNIRMGSTENSEVGTIENTKGNLNLTSLSFDGKLLSTDAKCIGAIEDSANETIYWFVHDKSFGYGYTDICDLIVSYNVYTNILTYHVISVNDGSDIITTLNFNEKYLITGVNIINDLLFFTDDYNPPRYINVNRNYANPIGYIDQFTSEQLLVIKKPPTESPLVTPIATSGQENYMDTRFISFAYRYRYIDGEYSATSQWSQISFVPNPFSFSLNSMLNEGMVNFCNTALINYNSGGPLVVGVDLLFKQSANNIIKVIEKLDKQNLGLLDNTTYQYTFSNSKIFTILSSSEILRLYDNVPRFAKAQTIMGNRLMYGNYVEGFNLIDKSGNPIKLEYSTSLITEDIGDFSVPDSFGVGNYTINGAQSIPDSVVYIDLDGLNLVSGAAISIQMTITHASFSGDLPFPTETTDNLAIDFSFFLSTNYTSVYQMAISPEFEAAVGISSNIKPVYSPIPGVETSCDGSTFTDSVNCIIPNNLDALQKIGSGISNTFQPINIIASPGSNMIGFQFTAMKFVNNTTLPTQSVYEYYSVVFADATFQEIANPQSLHSNRGYEIGIVYMDDFNRSTTALVSPNNTEHIPCGYSKNKNGIRVTIPPYQIAPAFATRYKFVIKPDAEGYEVIYSNLFFTDPDTNEVWFFIEGENATKIEVGDRLIVKADTSGPLSNCAYATVLLKGSKEAGFIIPVENVTVPAGVYMKINPSTFSAVVDPLAIINPGFKETCAPKGGNYSHLRYPLGIYRGPGYDPLNPTWEWEDFSIPAGSRIKWNMDWNRGGVGKACERRGYTLNKEYTASSDYDNIEDWFNGDNIGLTVNTGTSKDGGTSIEYIPTNGYLTINNFSINYIQWYRNPVTNQLTLQSSTGKSCTGVGYPNARKYCASADIEIFRALSTIIFETEPTDALPDVFFENNLSFAIDYDGNHMGNVTNQDIASGTSGVVDTMFFNCFAFGNGAESYKIRDSLIGRHFTLGERVTSVSAQDYKESDRFADITYSGIYNAESNVNKLNEFNLGLLDYKNLETSFGDIYVMDGRETDVLVLQEDKISYVLAGKNLLSDSAAGGAITSVPEVLGTQIARTEKYGISFNPESYVQWGFNRYFTDVKRGAVLQLVGDSYSNEQLKVISEENMRTWFRDQFNVSFNTQKLGGFDPYMNEYVLSTNDIAIPVDEQCLDCGVSQTFNLLNNTDIKAVFKYCVDLGPYIGEASVKWEVVSNTGGDFKINANYNGTLYSSGPTDVSGQFSINKNSITAEVVLMEVEYFGGNLVIDLLVDCPVPEELSICEVVLTNSSESGQKIHTQFRYTNGTFVGPLQSSLVIFAAGTSPVISRYSIMTGYVGSGSIPPEYSTMTIQTNKIPPDTFVFNPLNDKFKYLRTNVVYPNNQTGVNALLAVANLASPITYSGSIYKADFTVPDKTMGNILYLIWDFRDALPAQLCYQDNSIPNPQKEVCCECTPCDQECVRVTITNLSDSSTSSVTFPDGTDGCSPCAEDLPGSITFVLEPSEVFTTYVANDVVNGLNYQVTEGNAYVKIINCGCLIPCAQTCSQWVYINKGTTEDEIQYISCEDCSSLGVSYVQPNQINAFTACIGSTPSVVTGDMDNLIRTIYCGTCDGTPTCITYNVQAIVSTTVSYTNCGGGDASIALAAGSNETICCLYPSTPGFLNPSDAIFNVVGNGCNCLIQ